MLGVIPGGCVTTVVTGPITTLFIGERTIAPSVRIRTGTLGCSRARRRASNRLNIQGKNHGESEHSQRSQTWNYPSDTERKKRERDAASKAEAVEIKPLVKRGTDDSNDARKERGDARGANRLGDKEGINSDCYRDSLCGKDVREHTGDHPSTDNPFWSREIGSQTLIGNHNADSQNHEGTERMEELHVEQARDGRGKDSLKPSSGNHEPCSNAHTTESPPDAFARHLVDDDGQHPGTAKDCDSADNQGADPRERSRKDNRREHAVNQREPHRKHQQSRGVVEEMCWIERSGLTEVTNAGTKPAIDARPTRPLNGVVISNHCTQTVWGIILRLAHTTNYAFPSRGALFSHFLSSLLNADGQSRAVSPRYRSPVGESSPRRRAIDTHVSSNSALITVQAWGSKRSRTNRRLPDVRPLGTHQMEYVLLQLGGLDNPLGLGPDEQSRDDVDDARALGTSKEPPRPVTSRAREFKTDWLMPTATPPCDSAGTFVGGETGVTVTSH
jgi:hypothetical protein